MRPVGSACSCCTCCGRSFRRSGTCGEPRCSALVSRHILPARDGRPLMEILLTLTYVALCYATFKLFRIPVNQWTLATAALGGIFGLSLLFITMAYNHPFSTNARVYFTVTPILA